MCDNHQRALRVQYALDAYMDAHGETGELSEQEILCDLLADLRHWAQGMDLDFGRAAATAEIHFDFEAEEACEEGGLP